MMEDNQVHSAAESPHDSVWSTQLTHRQRVLLHAKPLLGLLYSDAHRSPDLEHYDSLSLAIKLFDLIIEHTGLDHEIDDEAAIQALTPLLEMMDRAADLTADKDRHTRMVEGLLDALRNDKKGRAPFEIEYIDFSKDEAIKRTLEIWILRNYHHPDGRVVLRLSPEAVNLFLNALKLDIEDAQAAAEAILSSQLERKQFTKAVESVRLAKLQSLRFQDKIERALEQTRRDISQVDWRVEVPRLLDDARHHIQSRCRTERGIIEYANEQIDLLPSGSVDLFQVVQIIRTVEECYQRHQQLVEKIIGARQLFLDEQERQAFTLQLAIPIPHLITDVLEPLLCSTRSIATQALVDAFPIFLGAVPPQIFNLDRFIARQFQPPRESPSAAVPIQTIQPTKGFIEPLRYPPEISHRAEAYLKDANGQRLSDLLQQSQCANEPQEVLEQIVWRVLHMFDPDGNEIQQLIVSKMTGSPLFISNILCDDFLMENKVIDD